MRISTSNQICNYFLRTAGLAALMLYSAVVLGAEATPVVEQQPVQAQLAEQPVQQPAAQPAAVPEQPVAETSAVVAPVTGQSLQTIAFKKDMPVTDALRMLAQMYQKNIVPSAKVTGNVTVGTLYDVTFEEAMDLVLVGNNHKYEVNGKNIRVYTNEEFEQIKADKRRMEYASVTLYYLSAVEAKKIVSAMVSADGKVETSSQAQIGLPSQDSIGSEAGGDNLAFQDTIVIYDYPENVKGIKDLLTKLDVRPLQVLVEATILSADLTEGMDMGVDLNFAAGSSITSMASLPVAAGTPIATSGFASSADGGLAIGITTGDVKAFITALETITDVSIMANPKILAVNKQVGQVYIGTKLPYRENTVETSGGGTQQGSVQFLDTGTKLSFRPYIGDDGFIRMDIHPKDSTGELIEDTGGAMPQETSAELRSNIIVKDGETIVIGGMFRDQVSSDRSQVPLLGNIPLLGFLFRSSSDTSRRQEVIVLLTPHIIKESGDSEGLLRADDVQRKRFGTYDRFSWLNTSRLAEDSYARANKAYASGDKAAALKEINWALYLRPSYLEAIRLQERILRETQPDQQNQLERIMINNIEKEEAGNWTRR